MLVSIVTFKLPKPLSVEEAAAVFRSTAPKYLNMPGLVRKHYYVSEQGDRAGGIYFWESRAAADACYTDAWRKTVTEKYGNPPDLQFVQVPVTVDNEMGRIEGA